MTDIHLLTNDLPTEEEINEWTRRSRKEGICGIVSCQPLNVKNALNITVPSHLDLLSRKPEGL